MSISQYKVTISSFNQKTPCSEYKIYTGLTDNIGDSTFVETIPKQSILGYVMNLSIDSIYEKAFLFVEHCDGRDTTKKLQGGYQITLLDLKLDDCFPTILGENEFLFNSGGGFESSVNKILEIYNNDLLIGGNYSIYSGETYNGLIKLKFDGTIDNTFNIGTGFNDSVLTIEEQTDNKILVGGAFTSYSGIPVNYIVRLNSNGSIDNTFNSGTGFDNLVEEIVLQPDNKILVGGAFTSYSGVSYNGIVRLNSDGSIDTTFDLYNNNGADNIKTLSNNQILVSSGNSFYRINKDGTNSNCP